MKHKDGSTDKYKEKHKEKRKEEKVTCQGTYMIVTFTN